MNIKMESMETLYWKKYWIAFIYVKPKAFLG